MTDLRTSAAVVAALNGYKPTDEQWRAISHPLEPAFLVAGAGSGKTAVMAARIVWAIEAENLPPSQILGLTFTNKAAEELSERVGRALLAGGRHRPEDITVQTYHAFAAGVVREHGLLVGVEPEAGLLSEAQQWQLVLSCIDQLPPFEAIELRTPAGLVRATLALAGAVSDHVVATSDILAFDQRILDTQDAPEDVRGTSAQRIELCRAVDGYAEAKRKARRIDFGDQVVKAVEILEGHPEVRAGYQKRFPVVLLDEYQDTNIAQRRMVVALVGGRGQVTAVGDARQAIYGWRGATMYNLIGFPKHFPKPEGDGYGPIPLSENFRSGRKILDVANRIVEKIDPERRPGDELKPLGDNGEGNVSLALFADDRAEAGFIAERCEELHGRPTRPGRDPVAWKDIAVLVRRKSAMGAIYEELSARDIPVEVVGLSGLLRTPEVTEVVAWLRCLDGRPTANRWLGRILMGPRWRIHYRDLALCARWAADQNQALRERLAGGDKEAARDLTPGEVGVSLTEALEHVDSIEGLGSEARRRLSVFRGHLRRLRRISSGPLLETIQEVIQQAGVLDALEASSSRAAPAARQNLSSFLDHVATFAPVEGEATLRSFLAYLDAADDAEETLEAVQPAEQDSVKLMTVHSAKGLEFECVFIPQVAASENARGGKVYSVFPDTRSSNPLTSYRNLPYDVREDKSHLPTWDGKLTKFKEEVTERTEEDERRLFYVALTRAKQRLYVSTAWWYGRGDRPKGPSVFWEEVEELKDLGLVEIVERSDLPEQNPLIESLKGQIVWPPEPRTSMDDELFPSGPGAAADELLSGSASLEDYLGSLGTDERATYEKERRRLFEELEVIAASKRDEPGGAGDVPDVISATQFAKLEGAGGESSDAWALERPFPERPTAARRLGTEVHRLIEERVRGVSAYPDETEFDQPSAVVGVEVVERMVARYESAYGDRTIASLPSGEPMIEIPFSLRKGDRIVRGRIDAVYELPEGGLEIVDFKTGKHFERTPGDQLDIYAEALTALGLIQDGVPVELTYAFLGDQTS